MPIRSVHLTNYYHKTSGGISTAYNHLLESANRHERYVSLIVPGEETSVEEIGKFGRIYYVKSDFSPVFDKRYRLMMPWKTYLFEGAPVKEILRKEDPDIIEIGEKYTLSLMAGLVRKHVLTVASKRPLLVQFSCERMDDNVRAFMSGGRFGKWLARRYTANYTLPMFDYHLTNSDYTAQEFFDAVSLESDPHRSKMFFNWCWRFLRAPKVGLRERVFVNQCGVDNSNFDPGRKSAARREAFLEEFGLPKNARLLLYAGRISPEKNTDLLIDALEAVSDGSSDEYRLLIAGGGPTAEQLTEKAGKRLPGKIVMIGHMTDKDKLADLFANCDVFIHPNPREPFGITPLEAMASGLAVVAPNSGGLLSYANETNAWLSEPNGTAFAASIRSVFDDTELRARRVEAGVATAARYDWDSSTDSLFALYDKMYADFTSRQELFDYPDADSSVDFSRTMSASST
ncbi:MAG: glycosyltransferase family 4 protein [Acidobacteriota bacterium]